MKTISKNVFIVTITAIIIFQNSRSLNAFWGFTDYSTLSPAQTITMLEKQQACDPLDPQINYNLGVAYHKNKDYQKASNCFNRTFINAAHDNTLKNQGLFNSGTAMMSKSTAALPTSWEKPGVRIDEQLLDMAIKDCQESIDKYTTLLERDAAHSKAITNKKYTQQLLKKLQQKKLQQQQQKQQDSQKNDKNKNDKNQDNKDQKNQDSKQSQEQGQDQNNKDNAKNGQKNNPDQKQNGDQQNERDKSDQQDQSGKQDGKDDKQKNQSQQDQKQEEKKNNAGQEAAEQKQNQEKAPSQPETQKEEQHKQNAGAGQEKQDKDKTEGQQNMPAITAQTEQQRAAEAFLKQVGNEEGKAQRAMLMKKIAAPKEYDQHNQKPW